MVKLTVQENLKNFYEDSMYNFGQQSTRWLVLLADGRWGGRMSERYPDTESAFRCQLDNPERPLHAMNEELNHYGVEGGSELPFLYTNSGDTYDACVVMPIDGSVYYDEYFVSCFGDMVTACENEAMDEFLSGRTNEYGMKI